MKQSQKQQILSALKAGDALTPLDALNRFGCFRIGARIWELRREGYNIKDIGTERYAKYKLIIDPTTSAHIAQIFWMRGKGNY